MLGTRFGTECISAGVNLGETMANADDCRTPNGAGMAIFQAVQAFRRFLGEPE